MSKPPLPLPVPMSRESTVVLDRHGRFWHDGQRVEHPRVAQAFARWIDHHPDDGRFILNNGYDWCYLTVEDTPVFVEHLRVDGSSVELDLSDGTTEPLDPSTATLDDDDVVRIRVKNATTPARFTRRAQLDLAPLLDDTEPVALLIAGHRHELPSS